MGLILILVLLILIAVTFPRWPYSKKWGFKYTSVLAIILAIILVLVSIKLITLWDFEIDIHDRSMEIELEPNYYQEAE